MPTHVHNTHPRGTQRLLLSLVAATLTLLGPALAGAQECFPACRSGYSCVGGSCVSACNPPCGATETCASGECVPSKSGARPAATPPSTTPVAATPPSVPVVGSHLHDGFFLRMAVGTGYFSATESGAYSRYGDNADYSSFPTFESELDIGGTIAPGFVLGGGVWGTTLPSVTVGRSFGDTSYSSTAGLGLQTTFGVLVDWYFNPAAGFHAVALLGPSVTKVSEDNDVSTGIGVGVGVGYEWWVSDQWSIGILGRVKYVTEKEKDGPTSLFFPALLLSTTYH